MRWVDLKGGAKVFTEDKPGKCKSCNADFIWATSKNSKWIPIIQDGDGWVSHFSNCPGAAKHRKKTNEA